MTPSGAEQLFFCRNFHPFSEVGNSRLHSTLFNYSRFYGMIPVSMRIVVASHLSGGLLGMCTIGGCVLR